MVSRFLVTTALEETWPVNDEPVLFLGEWCRLYSRKSVWEKLDAVVAPYHWDDRNKLHKDYLYLQTLYEELLDELVTKLNKVHGVRHSVRYWRILVGPWLGYFIQMLFDRWAMLRQALRDHDISGVRVLNATDSRLVPNDMAAFSQLYVDDAWNELIYGQLLEWMGISLTKVDATYDISLLTRKVANSEIRSNFKQRLATIAGLFSGMASRNDEHFFISSYLPIKQDFLLQLKLRQIPKLWRSVAMPTTTVNLAERQWQAPGSVKGDDFPAIVRAMISRHIPAAYLEGYQKLLALIEKLPWPNRPRTIFTSNSYNADDVFKGWAAAKSEDGTPIIIGQHGGGHGTHLWGFYEEHQIAVSDVWISWGWRRGQDSKIRPIGNLKMVHRNWSFNPDGGALMVEMGVPRYSYHMYSVPVASQWLDYLEDQFRFVAALPVSLQKQLLVRLYSHDYKWGQRQRWEDSFPTVFLDDGAMPMEALIKQSRLYISTYNATTFLETLAMNIPTIIFWNPKHWEMNDDAVPFYDRLKAVGILHDTPESAANHMIKVWTEITAWWESESVKLVRKDFCIQYSRMPEHPVADLELLFREVVSNEHRYSTGNT